MHLAVNQLNAAKGLNETESLLGDLTQRAAKRLAEFQDTQVRTTIAFQKAVLSMAGYGGVVDIVV